jgi:hypothetical protein
MNRERHLGPSTDPAKERVRLRHPLESAVIRVAALSSTGAIAIEYQRLGHSAVWPLLALNGGLLRRRK